MRRVLTLAAALLVGAAQAWATGAFPVLDQRIGEPLRPQTVRVLVGDVDDFHPGDPVDVPPMSSECSCIVEYCEAQPGMCRHADLDVYGDDRPIGLTVHFWVPEKSRIVDAELTLKFLAVTQWACNDFILTAPDMYPAIALQDLVGGEPVQDQTYVAKLDLLNVPTRLHGAPDLDQHWSGPPDTWVNLGPALIRDGRLDLVVGDDVAVDYAVLEITYVPLDPPFSGGKVPVLVSPNPAGGGDMTLSFALARRAMTTVEIFDVLGRRVATPATGVMGPGPLAVRWDGRADDGARTVPGTYFVRLTTEEGTGTAKVLRLAH